MINIHHIQWMFYIQHRYQPTKMKQWNQSTSTHLVNLLINLPNRLLTNLWKKNKSNNITLVCPIRMSSPLSTTLLGPIIVDNWWHSQLSRLLWQPSKHLWHKSSWLISRISYLNTIGLETISTPQHLRLWAPQHASGALASHTWTSCWRRVKRVWALSGVPSPPRLLPLSRWCLHQLPLLASSSCISNNVIQ